MSWEHAAVAYLAAGVLMWAKMTYFMFKTLKGEVPKEVPERLAEEIRETLQKLAFFENPLVWLAVAALLLGFLVLQLLRYMVIWPYVVYRRRRREKDETVSRPRG